MTQDAAATTIKPTTIQPKKTHGGWVTAILLALFALTFGSRFSFVPWYESVHASLTFENVPAELVEQTLHLLLVPLGSLLIVFVRLTLGIPMLGPFRPILLAIGFEVAGILPGSLFCAVILVLVTWLRPRLRGGWLPYFGRLSLLLSIVVCACLAAIMLGTNLSLDRLTRAGLFPVVVLCLTADGFARAVDKEGLRGATHRAITTITLAAAITGIVNVSTVRHLLFSYPELLALEMAGIVFVSTKLRLGLFAPKSTNKKSSEREEQEDDGS